MARSRHQLLIAAGWRYDRNQDRYLEPGADPQTGTWRNLEAAWLRQRYLAQQAKPLDDDPRQAHTKPDPRRSKPQ